MDRLYVFHPFDFEFLRPNTLPLPFVFVFHHTARLSVCRFLTASKFRGKVYVHLRVHENGRPTKNGIGLSLNQCKTLMLVVDTFKSSAEKDWASDRKPNPKISSLYLHHIGDGVYLTVRKMPSGQLIFDVRRYSYRHDDKEPTPTLTGLELLEDEFDLLRQHLPQLNDCVPGLAEERPCYARDDHSNQVGYLRCSRCNPFHYREWLD